MRAKTRRQFSVEEKIRNILEGFRKEKLCLVVYCSPDEMKKSLDQSIDTYNSTPHESLDNVTPNDVYAGRNEAILQRNGEKKTIALKRRKQYNLNMKNKGPDHHKVANSG